MGYGVNRVTAMWPPFVNESVGTVFYSQDTTSGKARELFVKVCRPGPGYGIKAAISFRKSSRDCRGARFTSLIS
jgi:hypothetical protein